MPPRDPRKSVSIRGATYRRLRTWCDPRSLSMSEFVEARIAEHLAAYPTPKEPPCTPPPIVHKFHHRLASSPGPGTTPIITTPDAMGAVFGSAPTRSGRSVSSPSAVVPSPVPVAGTALPSTLPRSTSTSGHQSAERSPVPLCSHCRKRPARGGRVLCAGCADAQSGRRASRLGAAPVEAARRSAATANPPRSVDVEVERVRQAGGRKQVGAPAPHRVTGDPARRVATVKRQAPANVLELARGNVLDLG